MRARFNVSGTRTLAALTTTALIIGLAATNASATPDPNAAADAVANVVTDASPTPTAVTPAAKSASGDFTTKTAPESAVTIPANARGALRLGDGGLSISLPTEASSADGVAANNGTVVYAAGPNGVATAVQASTNAVQVHTVIGGSDSPTQFTYPISGAIPVMRTDGGVDLQSSASTPERQIAIGQVAAPWAVDAAGKAVATHYQVRGNSIVQIVDVTSTTKFPVVADPSISYGWLIYVTFNRSESVRIANNNITDKAKYVAVVCAVIPNSVVAGMCGMATYDVVSSIVSTFNSAKAVNKCTQIGFVSNGIIAEPVSWHVISC